MDDRTEEAIFDSAMELEDPAERARFVAQACGGDRKLLADVEALLRSHDSRSLLDVPVLDAGAIEDESTLTEGPGTVIGRYKLLEKIGEGGMAVVYMAEQAEPIRRKVALKIIKLGMDTRQVIARFEAERQALALMDHPSIAKVLDAGATETGRPYFVMELVTGVSITEYCDKNNLSTKDRLVLFLQVCNAVQHAHQKGIIHRDIKPSNVMVTHHDGKPVPKVIDFGIAKATNQKLTEKTLFTRYAHIIGTPAYMSPEQAELSDLDIDTRTDIYSLGVLLYELLTGTTPFSEEELRKAGYLETQRVIREQEPVKPSTRIRTALRRASVPARRGTGILPVRVAGILPAIRGRDALDTKNMGGTPMLREVRGDLDWIVMKSLEKDRARRYETASGLAEDIRRHLEHEPVQARGPSTTYRLRKFLRRHRSQTIAALATVVFAGTAVVVLSLWNRDRRQLVEAEGFRHRGILSQAQGQYAGGERDAALETIQPILDSPHMGGKAQLLRAGILVDTRRFDEATAILKTLLDGRPEIAGAAHSLLARILWESDSLDAEKLKQIKEHRRQAEALLFGVPPSGGKDQFDPRKRGTPSAEAHFLQAMTALTVQEQLGALNQAIQLAARDEDFRNPVHYESRRLRAFTYYASRKYDALRDDALVMTILRPRDPLGYSLRAVALRELGKYDAAIADYDMALTLPNDRPQCLDLTTQRSETLLRLGRYEDVITGAHEALKLWSNRPVFRYHLFCALTALGDYEKAEAVFQEIVRSSPTARNQFWFWATKYVFDTLEAGRSWHRSGPEPAGAAFLPLVEAEETYRGLSAKAHRVVTNGFSAQWSPRGKKLAFSLGVQGYSGVALYDPATKETELLIVPGKDPKWSPDGRYIAFVRDCQALRLEELTATERKDQMRWAQDEEVWVMNADGTDPRRLARGGWPSWSQDSAHIYFQSRLDKALCSIPIVGPDVKPKRIMACSSLFPSVSPDSRRVAYLENDSLKVKDLASQAVVAEWHVPFDTWGRPGWSPTGQELCLGAASNVGDRTGLWIYPLDRNEPVKVLTSQIMAASWAPDGTKLVFALRPPYFELWTADLDPALSTVKALGPGQTLDEHWQQMLRLYTRRIKTDPQDAYAYSDRARCYDYLHERARAEIDMKRWSTVMSGRSPSDLWFGAFRDLRHIINLPFECELVFSAERPVSGIPVMCIAFGQKGRCEMKVCEVPLFIVSLFGFGLLFGLDVPPARADFRFGTPVTVDLPGYGDGYIVCGPSVSADGLELYSQREEPDGNIYVARRATLDSKWDQPVKLGPAINTSDYEGGACISADGLSLYFSRASGGIFVTRRATTKDDWGPPVNLGPVVNNGLSFAPSISADELDLYFYSDRPGGFGDLDIWVTTRPSVNDAWGTPINLGPTVNSAYRDHFPSISPDGLVLFFDSTRPGGEGSFDLYMSRRATKHDPWGAPVNLGSVISAGTAITPSISRDGSMLYFSRYGNGLGIWQAPILPTVDFNGDGRVDGKEVLAMAEHWGQNKSVYDIGPSPLGDGVVDANDLIVLAGYIGTDINDPSLIAHWAMDETAGMTAADSAGDNDAMVLGNAAWQPDGKIGGALGFDGKDDFARSGKSVLDPASGPFSVIAWVKGGAAGRVIVSQASGADWLYLNQYGMLTTDVKSAGRDGKSLTSSAFALDDQWHRVVLTWDGTNRALHMDGVEVARDTQPSLPASSGSLHIGGGKYIAPASFWSGLIDDVRIYNRAVQP